MRLSQSQSQSPANETHAPIEPAAEGSTRCDGCRSCGAILELDGCGHRFHPRCVFTWPLTQCEVCAAPVAAVRVFREFKSAPNTMARKGKWGADEHKYANMMMKQFQLGALPLADGLHLRGFISALLQCDPLRVTKKYAGHAIGKQNFFYQYRKSYCYNMHIKLQKRVSSLRNHFYWHIQYRCKFGPSLNIQELKAAESDYWVREFLRFAKKVGQPVEFSAHPVPSSPAPPASPRPAVHELEQEEQDHAMMRMLPASFSAPSSPVAHELAADEEELKIEAFSPIREEPLSVVVDSPTAPSSNKSSRASDAFSERSESPLSFDEWSDATPVFHAVLDGMVFEDLSQGESAAAAAAVVLASKPGPRGSLADWLQEEEARWNETMAVPSWSFTLSDCA
ncbi:hypothetical protein PybrP1_000173 [[Pythium] brassicae (nom. inval.)]|nr:hypothetical protein PybrP1_000173 [[Pythium] brassicae (nom. inval.)]